jgi:hypothetical protein
MKPVPLFLALALGVIIGVLLGGLPEESRPGDPMPADAPAGRADDAGRPADRDAPTIVFQTDTADVSVAAPRSMPDAPGSQAGPPVSTSDGITRPIDVGPVFSEQFANAERQGLRDALLDAHRALEREPRDDSWSYPLEAQIDNSLVADTSMGNFRKEHLECRSTMCEIRLSAEGGAQIEALRQWTSDIQRFPWAAELQLTSSSTVSSDERTDALLIVTRPPLAAGEGR